MDIKIEKAAMGQTQEHTEEQFEDPLERQEESAAFFNGKHILEDPEIAKMIRESKQQLEAVQK